LEQLAMNCQNSASDLLLGQPPINNQQQLNSLNSLQMSGSKIDELAKSQFKTREGTYRRLSYAEYSQPLRPLYPTAACSGAGVSLPSNQCLTPLRCSVCQLEPSGPEVMCFNVARDLFVYEFGGVQRPAELHKPILRRPHKNDLPTSHAFHQQSAGSDSCWLAIGFLSGHLQIVDVLQKDPYRSFNDEVSRTVGQTIAIKANCQNSPFPFLVAETSRPEQSDVRTLDSAFWRFAAGRSC
jgi:hypothetical protein